MADEHDEVVEPLDEADIQPLDAETLAKFWSEMTRDDRFTATMYERDDVLFILRMHLLLETLMDDLLDVRFPDSAPLLNRLTFAPKVTVLYESTPTPDVMRNALNAANWVRTRFAHLPFNFILSEEIWEKYKSMLHSGYIEIIEESVANGYSGSPGNKAVAADSYASRIRLGFLMTHKGLTTLLGMAHGHPDPVNFT